MWTLPKTTETNPRTSLRWNNGRKIHRLYTISWLSGKVHTFSLRARKSTKSNLKKLIYIIHGFSRRTEVSDSLDGELYSSDVSVCYRSGMVRNKKIRVLETRSTAIVWQKIRFKLVVWSSGLGWFRKNCFRWLAFRQLLTTALWYYTVWSFIVQEFRKYLTRHTVDYMSRSRYTAIVRVAGSNRAIKKDSILNIASAANIPWGWLPGELHRKGVLFQAGGTRKGRVSVGSFSPFSRGLLFRTARALKWIGKFCR